MNKIEELNVKLEKARNSAQKLDNQIRCIQEEIKCLEKEQEKPKFKRANYDEFFYTICLIDGKMVVISRSEINDYYCNCCFESNNYFLTKERAQEVADKMNFLLRMERLHDELCPDYVPDWGVDNCKYMIFRNHKNEMFECFATYFDMGEIYFPTREIAQQACDILNAELEQTKE